MRWERSIREGRAILNSKTPVARSTPAMCYGDNTDDVSIDAEDQPVWESLQRYSTVVRIKSLAESGQFAKDCCDTFYLQ
jgi:hypothetical protein